MSRINLYYVPSVLDFPDNEDDVQILTLRAPLVRTFSNFPEILDILTNWSISDLERAPGVYTLDSKQVLGIITECAETLLKDYDVEEDFIPKKKRIACRTLLQFFGSECTLEIPNYVFIVDDKT